MDSDTEERGDDVVTAEKRTERIRSMMVKFGYAHSASAFYLMMTRLVDGKFVTVRKHQDVSFWMITPKGRESLKFTREFFK